MNKIGGLYGGIKIKVCKCKLLVMNAKAMLYEKLVILSTK